VDGVLNELCTVGVSMRPEGGSEWERVKERREGWAESERERSSFDKQEVT
jgi:hypothetical protein